MDESLRVPWIGNLHWLQGPVPHAITAARGLNDLKASTPTTRSSEGASAKTG